MLKRRDPERGRRDGPPELPPRAIVERTHKLTTEAAELRDTARNLRRAAEHAEQRARDAVACTEQMRARVPHRRPARRPRREAA